MGREVKRVALNFDWPWEESKPWEGYLSPEKFREAECPVCEGMGWSKQYLQLRNLWYGETPHNPYDTGSTPFTPSTPEVRALAERDVASAPEYYGAGEIAIAREAARLTALFNRRWCHHLSQEQVDLLVADGKLRDFTHTFVPGEGWQPKPEPVEVLAADVNRWSLHGFGHSSTHAHVLITAALASRDEPEVCFNCEGHGSHEKYPGQRAEAAAWEPTEPPEGIGWQLWETVSEGSPITPVFKTADELASWMVSHSWGSQEAKMASSFDSAMRFIDAGWAPTMIHAPETGLLEGVEFIGREQ